MIISDYKYPLYPAVMKSDFREIIEDAAKEFSDKISFLEKDKDDVYKGITYKDFADKVKYLGEGLLRSGFKQRDKIGLIGKNCQKWAISYLAITTSNFVVIPLDKENKVNELKNIVVKSGLKAIIFDNKFAEDMVSIKSSVQTLETLIPFENNSQYSESFDSLVEKGKESFGGPGGLYDKIKINNKEVTSIIFTSGTTGQPKGVMLSQFNIISNIYQMLQLHKISDKDVFLSFLPLHHAYECTCGFLCQIYVGSTIAYAKSLRTIADNLSEAKATMLLGVPLIFESFYKKIKELAFKGIKGAVVLNTAHIICTVAEKVFKKKGFRRKMFKAFHDKFGGNLRAFISGGAALKKDVGAFFTKLGVLTVQGYGITECSPLLAVNRDKYYKFDSAGMPSPGLDIIITNKNAEGIGEIAVKGDNVMLGYYEEPELTNEAFMDGYFLTGDWGYIDKDNCLYITGRKKNVIVTNNGKNIYPEEIEFLYLESQTIDGIVIKSYDEGAMSEEVISAIIYPNYEYLKEIKGKTEEELKADKTLFIDDLKKEIIENNKKLASYKKIKYFCIIDEDFERTTTKKIKRFKIDVKDKYYSVF
ncbi:MAG TPA: AMP-binding protein [Spirochaetota bacterium]|nr:AMP-binding protein [Spirochaetota bacterium]HOS56595.1 AMP-binding protein [Spirochaetota bacterium]HPK61923.1 AMP-binding protein [Spirochaetota bacterium]HQF78871.1 AMP-binding protein [Spirochaetota bacterium]HQH31276.1 AMP-binding protein [Spirochaetota bacterium]